MQKLTMLSATLMAALMLLSSSCSKEHYDPANGGGNKGGQEQKLPDGVKENGEWMSTSYMGFTFNIRKSVYNTAAAQEASDMMKANLKEISELMPEKFVENAKKHVIWLEKDLTDGAAWFHAGSGWLADQYKTDKRYIPEKANCVEMCNYVHYVEWTRQNQPFMVLHEMCHQYHWTVLPNAFDNADVLDAYNTAMGLGLYVNTPYLLDARNGNGHQRIYIEHYDDTYNAKVYATTNQQEYFSEICEAYWGQNDYYPFDYYDLKAYDKKGFALMEKVWGKRNLPTTRPADWPYFGLDSVPSNK